MEKQFKKWIQRIGWGIVLVSIGLGGMISASPYGQQEGFSYKLLTQSVIINAPSKHVFDYLGNSEHAKDWSVFVNHITPLNEMEIEDGKVGSIRRCFTQADENEMYWDEVTTEVVPNKKRQLLIYNYHKFPMVTTDLVTEQLYEKINKEQTQLTFTVFYKTATPSYIQELKLYWVAYQIQPIFEKNMENIKSLIEQKYLNHDRHFSQH